MKTSPLLLLLFCLLPFSSFGQTIITGKIIDSQTKETLSFTSIAVPNSTTGTMSNALGEFELTLKEDQTEIQVSYIGYSDKVISIEEKTEYTIALDPYAFELTEVIVKSLTPLEYIQKALEKHPSLIPDSPFTTRSFFASKSSVKNDKTNSYKLDQAVFKTFYSDYANDTLNEASQLILHHEKNEGDFSSMLERNKRIKKMSGDQDNESNIDTIQSKNGNVNVSMNGVTGAGPALALEKIKSITNLDFFNSEYFDKFTYTFGDQTHYQGRELIRIDFLNKRKVDHTNYTGSIYLDHQDLAIVAIDYKAKLKVPFYVNALLKTLIGFTISDVKGDVSIRNQFLNKWYPKELVYDLDIIFKQKGEIEEMSIAQVLNIEEIIYLDPLPIEEIKIFDESKEYQEQIFPIEGVNWSDINIIKID